MKVQSSVGMPSPLLRLHVKHIPPPPPPSDHPNRESVQSPISGYLKRLDEGPEQRPDALSSAQELDEPHDPEQSEEVNTDNAGSRRLQAENRKYVSNRAEVWVAPPAGQHWHNTNQTSKTAVELCRGCSHS